VTGVLERVAPARLGAPFRWLLASSWAGNLGDGLALAAGPLLVAARTDDPFLVALAVLLQRLPWVLFGLAAGVVADRFDRRRIIVGVHLARTAVLVALTALIGTDHDPVAVVLAAMFLLGTTETFADTTGTTLLPMVVDRDDLPIGNARLMAGMVTINQLAGPPLGAGLFALSEIGVFAAQAACSALAAALAARMALPPHGVAPEARRHPVHEVVEGFRWLWHHAAVRTLAVTVVTFNVTYGAAWSVLVL
jgi:hypothetical protein